MLEKAKDYNTFIRKLIWWKMHKNMQNLAKYGIVLMGMCAYMVFLCEHMHIYC